MMKIIYEDENVLVVDKPAGISVHPAKGIPKGETIEEQLKSAGYTPYLAHRLDRETSGVLLVAKNTEARTYLQKQFQKRQVSKIYLALVQGHLKHKKAILSYPIARNPKNPLKRAVRASGKPSDTEYAVKKQYSSTSLLEVMPKTGRTHQIRVHLAYLGHPVIGDGVYGKSDPELNRQFLHAHKLSVHVPGGRLMSFTSPLPPDLKAYLNQLL